LSSGKKEWGQANCFKALADKKDELFHQAEFLKKTASVY
jgi:hypothetical protein